MDLSMLFLAIPIFLLAYQGVGMMLDARENQKSGVGWGTQRNSLPQKSLREFTSMVGKLGFNRALLRNKRLSERLELLLLRSGYPYGWKPEDFLFYKEFTGCFITFMLWRFGADQPMLWVLGFALGFWLPDVYIQSRVTARKLSVQRQLPGFIDLTALTLESGLDLLAAVERILDKMKPNALREELHTLVQETRLGTPRKEALQHLAYRVDLPDIQSLTSIIIQSEELGTSLATVLRNYAEDMRNRRILRAEEIAGKAPVKLLFPMMVFFFPIVFVIIFGPLALNFMSSYK
jgi:tight adherence protein C